MSHQAHMVTLGWHLLTCTRLLQRCRWLNQRNQVGPSPGHLCSIPVIHTLFQKAFLWGEKAGLDMSWLPRTLQDQVGGEDPPPLLPPSCPPHRVREAAADQASRQTQLFLPPDLPNLSRSTPSSCGSHPAWPNSSPRVSKLRGSGVQPVLPGWPPTA